MSLPHPDPVEPSSTPWSTLDPRHVPYLRRVWGLRVGVEAVVLAVLSVVAFADEWLTPAFLTLVVAFLAALVVLDAVFAVVLPRLHWRHAAWRVDERCIEIRTGVWWRSRVAVPRTRIQHLDVVQGPVQRRFGLGTLVLHTAGSDDASVPLPGLAHETALELRDDLAAWTKAHDGV
jgi:membrane protein YdbS with pleckstrin-like domain